MNSQQHQACDAIEQAAFDFTAKFYAAYDLHAIACKDSMAISPRAIEALKGLLLSSAFHSQRQRLFLFREAAGVLATIIRFGRRQTIATAACRALRDVLRYGHDQAHRAAAEAMGSLPLNIRGPALPPLQCDHPPGVTWENLTTLVPCKSGNQLRLIGRSIVTDINQRQLMVVKMARTASEQRALLHEVQWMHLLKGLSPTVKVLFDVPAPLAVKGAPLFRLMRLPRGLCPGRMVDQGPVAVGFTVSRSYFDYPNPLTRADLPSSRAFIEVMGRSAYLFGDLAGRGIVHASPIPLFHNRVQQDRRRDGGLYEWYRAGRLDRWLDSCAFPNFGLSGLRDFEHFQSFSAKQSELYRLLGNHLLSLLLVSASYFRAKEPCTRGWNDDGTPVDCRKLFDSELLHAAIVTVYQQYFTGFVGRPCVDKPPIDVGDLVSRMIEEMGVDRYMEEYLREADQRHMSQAAFEGFLLERGYTPKTVSTIKKGAGDLAIHTGPHLGAFNRGISIPELIEAVAAMAATCILERFLAM